MHFVDKIDRVLDLAVGIRLLPPDDNHRTNHIACSRYVELQVSWGSRATRVAGVVKYFLISLRASCASLVHWNLSYFLGA
jgi:hypothetical protein